MLTVKELADIPPHGGNRYHPEQTQCQLVEEGHAIGHAVVFDKLDVEPVGDVDVIPHTDAHVRLNGNLEQRGLYEPAVGCLSGQL